MHFLSDVHASIAAWVVGVSRPAQPNVRPLSDVHASIADWVVGVSRPAQPGILFQCAMHALLQKRLHVPDNLPL